MSQVVVGPTHIHHNSCFNTVFPPLTPKCIQPQSNSIDESLLCTEDEVHHLLLSLDVSKSNGPDGISPAMLKHIAGTIAPSLTKLLNISIRLSQLPSHWKCSLIVPIAKGSSTGSPHPATVQSHYCPSLVKFSKGIYVTYY